MAEVSLVLLPGWGLSSSLFEPLLEQLHRQHPQLAVQQAELPDLHSPHVEDWVDELDQRLPVGGWLGGWSLGGMLATALAARRGRQCAGLITLASNACFVARPDWTEALPGTTFQAFRQSCIEQQSATLKRFSLLCTQGCLDARALSKYLQQHVAHHCPERQLAGLEVLAQLDNRHAFQRVWGPQLHLLAEQDALVPISVAPALSRILPPTGALRVLQQTGHAALLEQPEGIARQIGEMLYGASHA